MSIESIEKALKEQYPDSTDAECYRFTQAAEVFYKSTWKSDSEKKRLTQETANKNLGEYLEWRETYGMDFDRPPKDADDSSIWEWAVRKALLAAETRKRLSIGNAKSQATEGDEKKEPVDYDAHIDNVMTVENQDTDSNCKNSIDEDDGQDDSMITKNGKSLPQIVFRRRDETTGKYVTSKTGTDLVHVLAAKIDRFSADNHTWAMAVAFYIDYHTDRESRDTYCIYVDARAGLGWPNPKLIMVVSLIGAILGETERRHPGRCKALIIFPIPYALTMIWGSVKGYFSAEMNDMMTVCSGSAAFDSPVPKDQLQEHVDPNVIDLLESCRVELFEPLSDADE